jgi:hypothetical protein
VELLSPDQFGKLSGPREREIVIRCSHVRTIA